jgi:hypothetical protein
MDKKWDTFFQELLFNMGGSETVNSFVINNEAISASIIYVSLGGFTPQFTQTRHNS